MHRIASLFVVTIGILCGRVLAQAPEFRTWQDASGRFSVEASFVEFKDGKVHLKRKDNGRLVVVPASTLSRADQGFIRELLAKPKTAPPSSSRGDWLAWRGPNGNGIADGLAPPTAWSESENVVWKTPVPGRGHASPIVVGDVVVLATADQGRQVQSVVAFDRKSGRQLWTTDVSQGGFPPIHQKNTHASGTVASDGERLFALFNSRGSLHVTALDLSGKKVWQQVAGPFQQQQYKFGYGASPLVYNSTVIVAADCDAGGYLAALDTKTGREAWRAERPSKLSYSSPIVGRVAGRDQLLISGCELVAGYDPDSGRQLWQTPATTMSTCGTMVWEGDLVFASGGYPKSQTVAVRADGSGRVVWRNNQKCYEQSMLAHDGYVYGISDAGVAYCWEAETGRETWKARLGGPVSASPIMAGGTIYQSNERGTTFVFKANPQRFESVARNQLGDEAFASPTIVDGRIYLRVASSADGARQETLYCIGE